MKWDQKHLKCGQQNFYSKWASILLCPMRMTDIPSKITVLFDHYRKIEQSIQAMLDPVTRSLCVDCAGACCREAICRESIQSPFLNALVYKQGLGYDDRNGWLTKNGCRLKYGRPQVCYAYFCDGVLNKQPNWSQKVAAVIKAFSASGDRALGGTHLISVQNLDELSFDNISKIIYKINQALQMISHVKPTFLS